MLKNKCSGLFADPGMGKTSVALSLIKLLGKKALIIAPLRVCYTSWPNEISKWNQFNNLEYKILHDKNKNFKNKKQIEIINPEGLKWLFENNLKNKYDILIVDESTKFKNWTAKRTKLLKYQLQFFDRRYILTGTPTPNSLMDLFSQIYILDQGELLGKYITHYRNKYFTANQFMKFTTYDLKAGADKLIEEKIKPITFRLDSKDYLDLPPLIYNNIYFELSKDVYKVYRSMEKDLSAKISDVLTLAGSAAIAYGKCRQIVSGKLYDDKQNVINIHKEKIEALKDLIEELHGKPVLVSFCFKHEKIAFKQHFKNIEFIDGTVSAIQSRSIIARWNRKEIPILFCHPKSVAHGLNLQEGGNDIVHFSITDNYEEYDQLNQRIYRQNVKGTVRIHHIIAKNTIDEIVLKRNQTKEKNQQSLLDALKRGL